MPIQDKQNTLSPAGDSVQGNVSVNIDGMLLTAVGEHPSNDTGQGSAVVDPVCTTNNMFRAVSVDEFVKAVKGNLLMKGWARMYTGDREVCPIVKEWVK